jgi:hypothetical protein
MALSMTLWLIAVAVLTVGLLLVWGGRGMRRRRGLGEGRTVDLDDRNLALGHTRESVKLMKAMVWYVERWKRRAGSKGS